MPESESAQPTDAHVSETRYRQLLSTTDVGFCIFRVLFDEAGEAIDYVFLEANPAFELQTGLRDPVGKTALELVPELEREWIRRYGEVARSGDPDRFTLGSVPMGRVFDVYAFRSGEPGSNEVALLFTDVTEQRKMEESLLAEKERVTAILESITDGFLVIDRDWRFAYVNPQAERILDRRSDDLLGRVLWEEFPGLDESGFGGHYRRVASEGAKVRFTAYYPLHDRWYEVQASPVPGGIGVYFRNVTETVRSDEERELLWRQVEEERRKLALAHDQSFAFVAILQGPDLVFEYVNASYLQLVNHRDVLGRRLEDALPEVVEQGFPAMLRHVIESGESLEWSEIPVMLQPAPGAPPEERTLSLRYMPMHDAEGRVNGVYAHGIDISEMVRARRTLAERAEETALGSRRKDEFLATLAHELRNPLAPIRLSTELMGMLDPSDPEFEEARIVIARQVDHMVRLVDDLLDVSRVAQGKINLKRAPVDVAEVVRAAAETSRPAIEAGGHAFEISLPDDRSPNDGSPNDGSPNDGSPNDGSPNERLRVNGDATRLAQVVSNLLNNAAKYTPHGGRISLVAERERGEAVLRVSDDGVGIPPEMLPHIFDMFTQVEVHLAQSQGGLGIGLTLARRLIEMHEGSIEAASEGPGRGSEFTIRLPLIDGDPSATATARAEAGADDAATTESTAGSRRVLVVDDNEDGAWTLSELLQKMGHDVRIAHSGREGLAIAERFVPEVVLLDVGLPDIAGYEVARRLRADERFARTRIVAQTGWGREEDRAVGRDAGFDDHLVKPLARTDLERMFSEFR